MRTGADEWPDGHCYRWTPRDFETFAQMDPGGEYPHAHRVSLQRWEEALTSEDVAADSERGRELYARTALPYDPTTFPNRMWKLRPDAPCRTLIAHLGKTSNGFVHYDGAQGRTITVREAMRLHGYPDDVTLAGPMGARFRQVGNSVPPPVAQALGGALMPSLAGQ